MKTELVEKLKKLMRVLGYPFQDTTLLQAAITHRSIGHLNNERLEFLGDSVLNFTIAAQLYTQFPKASEGELTRTRALLVRGETVAKIAREMDIGEYLSLGAGEKKTGGHQRESILADALEAIIGAIFLDGGVEACRTKILEWYGTRLDKLIPGESPKDAKTELQEYLQARHLPLPIYHVLDISGDLHSPTFRIECQITALDKSAIGTGNSRRKAEQAAARAALKTLGTS